MRINFCMIYLGIFAFSKATTIQFHLPDIYIKMLKDTRGFVKEMKH